MAAYISTSEGGKIRIQLTRCRIPFGVRDGYGAENATRDENSRPSLDLDMANQDFVHWTRQVDQHIINFIAENSTALLKKQTAREVVADVYRRLVPENNSDFNPLFRTKINRVGTYSTTVFLVTDPGSTTSPLKFRPGTIEDIQPHDEILPIIEISNIWFANKQYGVTVSLVSAMLFKHTPPNVNNFYVEGVAGVKLDTPTIAGLAESRDNEDLSEPF